ncbi:LAFE_0E01706g1_1 [Lachancea fermentati]|uniref:LAFE_0E01706g1_1 n=1 Tax=Lachancea fermentati TaxID=4955 RepID=A0A1G4MCN0_LACFM|nr:LAFE_0E01706g1_1 [Lachancea fermentati]
MLDAEDAIQLINEDKEFNQDTLTHFRKCIGDRDVGVDYHVISVFGSQSSGKSTLLNALFNTTFDTMNAQIKRQQTTKGIWLGYTRNVTNSGSPAPPHKDTFVLDVEGSDGAERGEDQDFERKAALFAIAISEVLIVNMWEQQVGLYQGNNMALLKTVFEVNLSLFGHKKNDHKVLLLFVIRDHIGVTPLSSLQETLETELVSIWSQLSKPEGTEESSLYDFFDLKFAALAHKLLQPDQFMEGVKKLGDSFTLEKRDSSYFKPDYHHNLPLDGWTMYAENCWEQIETNKDLDLPTQQILVALFKTDEIASQAYANFTENYESRVGSSNQENMASILQQLKTECLQEYDTYGSRYARAVYLDKRNELVEKIQLRFTETLTSYLLELSDHLVSQFRKDVLDKTSEKSFIEKLSAAKENVLQKFEAITSEFTKLELVSSLVKENDKFNSVVEQEAVDLQEKQLNVIYARSSKFISSNLKEEVTFLLGHPDPSLWDLVLEKFNEIFDRALKRYQVDSDNYDFQLGFSADRNKEVYTKIRINAWISLYDIVRDYLTEDMVVSILRERFENYFRYDENESPRLWKNGEEIDNIFRVAREQALDILDVLSTASTSNCAEIIPDVPLSSESDDHIYEDEEGVYHSARFAHIFTAQQKEKILQKFKRQADYTVIEAKRSTIKTTTHIPLYIYALMAVLGWNEFMMIIRNPLFVTIILILGVGFFFIHKLNLWNPLITVINTVVNESRQVVKDKLRSFLVDDHPQPSISRQGTTEEFELQDLIKPTETKDSQSEQDSTI